MNNNSLLYLRLSYITAGSMLLTGVSQSALAQSSSAIVSSPVSNTPRVFNDRASVLRDSEIDNVFNILADFYPAIEVSLSRRDNIYRIDNADSQSNIGDTVLEVKPSLAYRTNFGRHKFYAAYTGVYRYYSENDTENARSNKLNGQLSLDITNRIDLNLFAETGTAIEDRGISGSRPFNRLLEGPDTGPDEYKYRSYGADVVYGRKTSPLNIVLGTEKSDLSYDNNNQGASGRRFLTRDRETDSVHLDISYEIGSKTSVFGRLEKIETNYESTNSNLSNELNSYLVGLRWSPSSRLSGVVGVGSSDKEYDNPIREGYKSSIYYANVNYSLRPFSKIAFGASRSLEEPSDINSDYYISDYLGAGWNHSLSDRLSFSVYAKFIDDKFDIARNDKYKDIGLSIDYDWRQWLKLGVYAGNIDRNSNRDEFDYSEGYYGIRLRSDLRPLLKGRANSNDLDSLFDYPRK